jgi:hypothetical protein
METSENKIKEVQKKYLQELKDFISNIITHQRSYMEEKAINDAAIATLDYIELAVQAAHTALTSAPEKVIKNLFDAQKYLNQAKSEISGKLEFRRPSLSMLLMDLESYFKRMFDDLYKVTSKD